jgi:hypothetical protein
MSEKHWDARPKVSETVIGLRERAASLRWAAGIMQDADRARDLRQFADQLERQAATLERHLTGAQRPPG